MSKRSIVTYPLKEQAAAELKAAAVAASGVSNDTDIAGLLDKTLEILRREITHLMVDSSIGKLGKDSSTALVSYVKLLKELHEDEQELLNQMSEEELLAVVEKRNVKSQPKGSSEGTEET